MTIIRFQTPQGEIKQVYKCPLEGCIDSVIEVAENIRATSFTVSCGYGAYTHYDGVGNVIQPTKNVQMVKFSPDASNGDTVLQLSITGPSKLIAEKLRNMANEIDSKYGKPRQGITSQYGCTSHVTTPVWGGVEY